MIQSTIKRRWNNRLMVCRRWCHGFEVWFIVRVKFVMVMLVRMMVWTIVVIVGISDDGGDTVALTFVLMMSGDEG